MPPQPSLPGILSLAEAQTGSSITRLRLPSQNYRVAFAMWKEWYFGASARRACRPDYQAWLLEQTESAAESGDSRPFWSLVRALKGKRRRLVPRPVLDSAGVSATELSRVAELMGELFCTEFGHRVKIQSLDDFGPSSLHPGDQAPVEVPAVADVQAALEPLTGLLEREKATGPDSVPNEILRGPSPGEVVR